MNNTKPSKDRLDRDRFKNVTPSLSLLASFSLSSPRVPRKIESRAHKHESLGGTSSSAKQNASSLPWYADTTEDEEEEEEVQVPSDAIHSLSSEVSDDVSIFLTSASETLLSPIVSSVLSSQLVDEQVTDTNKSLPIAESSLTSSEILQQSDTCISKDLQYPIDLSYYYPRGFIPQLHPSVTITPLDKSLYQSLGPLRRRVRALWMSESALDDVNSDFLWDGFDKVEQHYNLPPLSKPSSTSSSSSSSSSTSSTSTAVTYSHRGVESIITRPIHPAPKPLHQPSTPLPASSSISLGDPSPPFSSLSVALAMSSLAPLELATCLEIKELVNDSLRKDLRLAQTSHMDALKELDPQQQEAEMGLSFSSSSTINSSTSSSLSSSSTTTIQPHILSDDILRLKASTARQEAVACVENAPKMVETSITSQKVASLAEELYNELRRRARFEASSLEHYSDELKLLTPSLERVISETQAVLNNVYKSLMKISSTFALVSSTAAELNENEDLVKKEEEFLDMWESSLGVCNTPLLIKNGSNSSTIDNSSNTSQIDLLPTPKRSHPPSLPHQLLDQIAFAEDDERKVVANSYNRKLTDMRSDIEARIRVIKNGEVERIETAAKEVENELASSFDVQMALITAREKAAEKTAIDLSTRLSSISSELVSIRTLKRLRGQVRRMWAVSQPDRLCLALDCDSEGWKDDEEDEEVGEISLNFENIRAIEADSLKIKHTREIADANAIVQLRKNEHSVAMAALDEATLRIETEARKMRRARVSPLVSLGLFTRAISDAEMKSEDKSVMNSSHTVRTIDSLPMFTIDQSLLFDPESRDDYLVNESLPSALLNEKRAVYKELENSSAVKTAQIAKAALALAEKKLVEAEQVSQYLRIRQERRAAALMLKRTQRHQRAAAALLAKGVIDSELEEVRVGKEGWRDSKILETATLITTPVSSTLLSDTKRKSERVDLFKWRESVRKLTHEQRMRNAICRFLTKAVRAVPYDPDYAVVLTVAQKVGQRILKRIESSKGEVAAIPPKSPLLNDTRFGNSSSLSLLGVIDRIVKSVKESNERNLFGGVGMDNLAKRLLNGESDEGKALVTLEGESLCEDKTSASKIAIK
jgi:hypothetical protein